jgi:hypothetical protein
MEPGYTAVDETKTLRTPYSTCFEAPADSSRTIREEDAVWIRFDVI